MDKLGRIIREEIEKYIINENSSAFNQLLFLGDNLEKNLLQQLGRYEFKNNEGQDIRRFFANLEIYSLQIIFAIKRCVNAQNINESFFGSIGNGVKGFASGVWNGMKNSATRGLNAYGINVPNEINFWNNTKNGYYASKRAMNGNGKNQYTNNTATVDELVNKNNIKSKPLQMLLEQDYIKYENAYSTLTRKYGSAKMQIPQTILLYIKNKIYPQYESIKQSQGTQNP